MIIQKAGVIKFTRYLAIFCAITMGFICIVASSEDDIEDELAFDKNLQVASVEVTEGDPAPSADQGIADPAAYWNEHH